MTSTERLEPSERRPQAGSVAIGIGGSGVRRALEGARACEAVLLCGHLRKETTQGTTDLQEVTPRALSARLSA